MTESTHSLAAMTYGSNRYYSWRCACGIQGRGEAPAGSSKEDVAGCAWRDHDALVSVQEEETTGTPRIRWEPTQYGGWTGHVGALAAETWLFQVWNAASVGGEWQLDSTLPGNFNRAVGTDPDDLKAEAERLLAGFVASLGASFGPPVSPQEG
jgi:hypothetical protein